jgi:hypothetical protein
VGVTAPRVRFTEVNVVEQDEDFVFMSTATKEAPKAECLTDYRVTVRHCPFRTKSRVVEVARKEDAWPAFLNLLQEEHAKLTDAQRKVVGQPQAAWLAAHSAQPPDTEVLPEREYQDRRRANEMKEQHARQLYEAGQRAMQDLAGGVGSLVSNFPVVMRDAIKVAVTEAVAAVMAQHAPPPAAQPKHGGK